ncbi:cytochrome c oxidase subunit NDUFA4-like [Pteronotus mesoamericanus]|uniref:cytochrome c oxidase subunit NDUFA4-like n=1 Tax=Pteronotus mesoamericanus TaxID=1884717 RepID=UPI0023EAC5B6|nr:cytochrome c oxidase subunit NDUFA4-like [Pteronotus parnellii mesoamericanus]
MPHHIISQTKKHPILITIFVFIGAVGTGKVLCVMCLALFNPDVRWDKRSNREPWNKQGPKEQYKFYLMTIDYSRLKKEGPDI